jgi:terminase large subunit-like protein
MFDARTRDHHPPEMVPFEATTAAVRLPTFHAAQAKLRWTMRHARFVVARCGRRWGKNVVGESVATDDATKGLTVGWFAPENRRAAESYNVINELLDPIKKNSSKTDHVIRTITGGQVDFWSLEDENAGRGRKYHRAIFDEAAFTKPKTTLETWQRSVKPTLLDYRGRALIMSNTNGIDPDNFLYAICQDPTHGFVQFHAPTRSNPFLPKEEVEALQRDNLPLVYQQEYLAEFVDWSGAAFFSRDKLLLNGEPVEDPVRCEAVFAVVDSATKTGKKNDGTGMVIFALIRHTVRPVTADGKVGPPYSLVILDWDLIQIEGASLELWLPGVFDLLNDYAAKCKAVQGSLGAMIEDKSSGTILLQQAQKKFPGRAHPIDSKLTALGKDERAISVSGYHYRGLCRISRRAYEKVTNYKGTTRNHLLGQVVGFRVGDKDATREDDLLDCYCYGLAITLGNAEGF